MKIAALTTIFNVFNSCSIFGSLLVVLFLFRYSRWNTYFSRLIAMFHVSLILEDISSYPYIYRQDRDLCIVIEFFHAYFDMMNVLIVFALVIYHCMSLLSEKFLIFGKWKHFKYTTLSIIFFPFICSFFFITNSFYVSSQNPWCSAPHGDNRWPVVLFYVVVWICLVVSIIIFLFTWFHLWRISVKFESNESSSHSLAPTFFNTVGWYCLCGIAFWVPRSILRFTKLHFRMIYFQYFVSYIPTAISGIIFTIIFFLNERKALRQWEDDIGERGDVTSFSWEEKDVMNLFEEGSSSSLSSFVVSSSVRRPSQQQRIQLSNVVSSSESSVTASAS
jgi:magnesium-transporting ATPase (P-type)